jgi:hypothetical protein
VSLLDLIGRLWTDAGLPARPVDGRPGFETTCPVCESPMLVLVEGERAQDVTLSCALQCDRRSVERALRRRRDGIDPPPLGAIPAYPVAALPRPARELVEHGELTGLAVALTAGAGLAAMATAVGAAGELRVTSGWVERAILWVPLLAPRGAGKSPAQTIAFAPLRAHDARLADDDDEPVLTGELTIEALARALHSTGGATGLDLDELAVLLRGFGEYKNGASGDRGRLLGLWSGVPWGFQRVGGGKKTNAVKLRIGRPTLVVCGGLQPHLHDLLGGDEDGLRPRWLPHLAPSPLDDPDFSDGAAPGNWSTAIGNLLAVRETQRTWTLSRPAREAFRQHRAAWKLRARSVEETASTSAALVKADIHLARVALVLAELDDPGAGGEIGASIIERAARIVDFTLGCWRALPENGTLALTRRDEILDRHIVRLIGWLDEHGGRATRRQLQIAKVAGCRTVADLDALLGRYSDAYPGLVQEEAPSGGRGLPTIWVESPTRRGSAP